MIKNIIEPEMYYSDFWIKISKESKEELLSKEKVEKYNEESFKRGYLKDIFKEPEILTKEYIIKAIEDMSKIPSVPLYNKGALLKEDYFKELWEALNLSSLKEQVKPRYGIITERTEGKIFPTEDRAFKKPEEYSLDRFMETALYVGEPCIIYHESLDGQWYFCSTFNATCWIKRNHIALGEKEAIEGYARAKKFIVVTGKKLHLGYNPLEKRISEVVIDMGVKLPIENHWDYDTAIYDMYPEGNYIVKVPLRAEDGSLVFTKALVPVNEEIHEGYLRCTRSNVLKQIFKFQGERYGWGGEFHGRDCSALILDTLRTFGILFPRNSGEQLNKSIGKSIVFSDENKEAKLNAIKNLKPGDLIFLKGHVVMVIGKWKGDTYIIHDTIGMELDLKTEEGSNRRFIPINGVTISNLNKIYTSSGADYIEAVIGIKQINIF